MIGRFLDNVANRIVEAWIAASCANIKANFTAYQAKKAEQLEIEAVHNRKFDKFWKQEKSGSAKVCKARPVRRRPGTAVRGLRLTREARMGRAGRSASKSDRGRPFPAKSWPSSSNVTYRLR